MYEMRTPDEGKMEWVFGIRVSGLGSRGEMRMKSPKRPHRSHNGDQYSSADSGLYGFIDM